MSNANFRKGKIYTTKSGVKMRYVCFLNTGIFKDMYAFIEGKDIVHRIHKSLLKDFKSILVEDEKTKFKVGDKVMIVGNPQRYSSPDFSKVGEIVNIGRYKGEYDVKCNSDDITLYFLASDLKKVSAHYPYGCKPVFKIEDFEDDKVYTVRMRVSPLALASSYTGAEFKKSIWKHDPNRKVLVWEEMK